MNLDSFSVQQWVLLYLSAVCIGMSRTSIIVIGSLASAIFIVVTNNVAVSAGIALPLLLVGDTISIIYYRKHIHWKLILPLFPWIMIGVTVAHIIEAQVNAEIVKDMIAYLLLVFLILSLIKIKLPQHKNTWLAGFFGTLAGFTSMLANVAGPIMNIYLLLKKVDKMVFISSSAWFFAFMNTFKLMFRISSRTINKESLTLDLKLVAGVFVGACIGVLLIKIIPEKIFRNVVLLLTLVVTIQLLVV